MHYGIDVSTHQGVIDWAGVAADKYSFAIVKATQGRSEYYSYRDFVDSRFAANVVGASEAGLRVGVYHFLTAQTDDEARAEARFFCAAIEPYRERITLWAAVDVESRHLPADKVKLTGIVKAFCAEVAAHGFAPMVYTNPNWLKNRLNDLTKYPLWLALWRSVDNPPAGYTWAVWQHTSGGWVQGIAGNVDLNLAISLPTALNQTAYKPPEPPTATDPTPEAEELTDADREYIKNQAGFWRRLYNKVFGGN
jgi:GH25 family lysozyme M1 (1,4-beta-N-acetylmuramidase)